MKAAKAPGIRQMAGVSGAAMNAAYRLLRAMTTEELGAAWRAADPHDPAGALLRWQIGVTLERRADGRWPGPRSPREAAG
jgi:hypothetical protein